MKALWTVFRKELIDAFRDRRTVLVAFVVLPVAVPLILAGMSALGARKQSEKLESTLVLPVVGAEYAPNLVTWLGSNNVEIIDPPADAEAKVRSQQYEVIVRIGADFSDNWHAGRPAPVELIYDSSRPLQSGTTVARVRGLLQAYDRQVGMLRLIARLVGGWTGATLAGTRKSWCHLYGPALLPQAGVSIGMALVNWAARKK